jgi:transcriptional regulator
MHLITDTLVPTAGPGQVLIRVTVALVDGEFDEDLVAAGVPVRDFSGRIVAALSVSAPAYRMQDSPPRRGPARHGCRRPSVPGDREGA